jgi:hypothetical protein
MRYTPGRIASNRLKEFPFNDRSHGSVTSSSNILQFKGLRNPPRFCNGFRACGLKHPDLKNFSGQVQRNGKFWLNFPIGREKKLKKTFSFSVFMLNF